MRNTKSGLVTTSGGDLFEAFGFRYFGPIDGNNIEEVVKTLRRLKDIKGPKILHACTIKGKGYAPAESDPTTWHAPGKFNPETGERPARKYQADRYQDVFGQVLCELAEKDPTVVGITPAMATGSGMTDFAARFPDRFFDVGIAEEHAVTFAAGLAAGGMKPYCVIYSSFAQRAYDEIVHDVALQHLNVVLCLDRAGLVGEDGATHQGAFDLASLRCIPNTVIAAPKDETELKRLLNTGLGIKDGPLVIRYPRGIGEGANRALEAAERLRKETGKSPAVFNVRFLKPFDQEILKEAAGYRCILTLEDGAIKGGLFSEVSEYVASTGARIPVIGVGIPDRFITQAPVGRQREQCGLTTEIIYSKIVSLIKNN